ncbi:MAG: dihydroxyacetone kinase subunit L [Roseiflexus sp.]|jgi:dihydroxyacetone kinase, phosphoprotein-dependent, L subunit|nr:dihydroxyacetone kinase subunit L [Roseiflexus sp.]MBO9334633.1 dihydroxyacetone kinase subunit L [Roseiflexus sp.]MBO9366346.1 dihydroxyacetone kinase subunit L [Roseiflexus sp.]MBO9381174.1 dihydroxyacetone kinase subunit L [Roseiflexus sp.]MBO9388156.1 dihydroxyacetone kinase subunit L [Roseiflexus sp.]
MPISRDDVLSWLRVYSQILAENKDYLTQLDSSIGDADHGVNMDRGFKAVLGKLPTVADKDIGTILKSVGMTLVQTVGGASGPLYGTFFLQAGVATANKMELSLADWVTAIDGAIVSLMARGKANVGDKTMVDALVPALNALKQAVADGLDEREALRQSVVAAEQGMKNTIPMVARRGRASYLAERSAGHQDPGATSSYLMFKAMQEAWTTE